MPELLLKLKNVPEDEYHDVIDILESNNIEYYETNAGFWGLGLAGVWLRERAEYDQAVQLLDVYYQTRQQSAQEEYRLSKEQGTQRTLWSTFMGQPGYFILYLSIIVGLLALTISPFLALI
jgi:hypothetical protein